MVERIYDRALRIGGCMKTAIYIEDGAVQLVITPETVFEKDAIKMFNDKPLQVKLFEGTFYDCRGGWIRQNSFYPRHIVSGDSGDKSLILRIDETEVRNATTPSEQTE